MYVFARTADSWTLSAKLTAADGAAGDLLGLSVAIDGDTIVAGAPFDDFGANADQGSASIFFQAASPPPPPPPTDGGGTPPPSGGGQPVAPGKSGAPALLRPSPGEAGWRWSSKLRVSRAQVLRDERLLDVLAPITSRAGGQVDVAFRAAGRTTSFTAPITDGPVTLDQVRFREAIPREQADLGTGIVTLSYPGDGDTRPNEVRLRAARNAADLEVERLSLQGDRLQANGTLTDRARGVVRLEFSHIDAQGLAQTWKANTEIQEGEWSLDEQVPPDLATYGGYLSVLYTGNYDRRIRGEMTAYDLRPGQTRTPD